MDADRLVDITYRRHAVDCVCHTCLPDLAERDRVGESVPAACVCCAQDPCALDPRFVVCQCLACLEDRVAAQRAHIALVTGSPLYSVLERARREYWIQAQFAAAYPDLPGHVLS